MFTRQPVVMCVAAAVAASVGLVAADRAGLLPGCRPGEDDPYFRLTAPLDPRLEAIDAQIQFKEELYRRLIAGTIRLTDVTALILGLHADDPHYEATVGASYPSPTLAGSTAQCVIGAVRIRVPDGPGRREVMVRLEREFDEAGYGSPSAVVAE